MKVLVHNSIPGTALGRLPVLLSVMQELIDAGHRVVVIECDGVLPACLIGLEKDRETCLRCMARADKGRRLVRPSPRRRPLSRYLGARRIAELLAMRDDLPDVQALKNLRHEGADLGYAALSSYAEMRRDPEPDLGDPAVRGILQNLINTGRITYEAWRRILARERPDRVVLFNGRLAVDRGVVRLCQQLGVDCHVYEVSSVVDRVIWYDNALPQDIDCVARQIESWWASAPADREAVGGAFYEMRRAGASAQLAAGETVRTNDRPYIRAQRPGELPADWDPQARNIVVFGSSDDEYSAISAEWEASVYGSQAEAADAVCRGLAGEAQTRIWFRMHPRLIGMERPFIRRVLELEGRHSNLRVIGPDSPVSTYAMLDNCDVACSFRSTMGLEATFWGKPSVTLANSIFCRRGATYDPTGHGEVMELLRRRELAPRDRLPALKYGYYRLRMGFANAYYRGGDPGQGVDGYRFKGDPIAVGDEDLRRLQRFRFGRWARWLPDA